MRIAYVINSVEGGGAQSPLPRIVAALENAGAKVTLLALTRRNGKALPALQRHGVCMRVREGGERDHFAALRWIAGEAASLGSEVLWTSLTRATLLGQIAGQRLGLPVVSWQHNAYLKPLNARLLRLRAPASALWIADSDDVALLTRERLRIPADRLVTWPIFAADADAEQGRRAEAGERLRFGSLGRLHPNKGYDVLIEALHILARREPDTGRKAAVIVGGTGEEEARLRQLADERGVSGMIDFIGHVDDPATFLASCDAYLQPSRREGFCIAAHEAMQAGLPMIVSRTGQMPLTVTAAEAGLVVEAEDPEMLAHALTQMIKADRHRAVWGANGRAYLLEHYSQQRFDAIGAQIVARIAPLLNRR